MADENQSAGNGGGGGRSSLASTLFNQGMIPLFRVAGISVSLHWTWFLIAAYQIYGRKSEYHAPVWKAVEYLALFGIVLMHEFGHALACRQTGGKADRIILWPLGGIAFVQPPLRPGALLWSIVAGPLVNVVLLPVTWLFFRYGLTHGWEESAPDLLTCAQTVMILNAVLLGFNILPIYPLDGGQILQALLWFFMKRSTSLLIVTTIGVAAGVSMVAAALYYNQFWFVVMGGFMIQRSVLAFQYARKLRAVEIMPRTEGFACPSCGEKPLAGALWRCGDCGQIFDTFANNAVCPGCGKSHETTTCPFCKQQNDIALWRRS